jgi:hypothetical protein
MESELIHKVFSVTPAAFDDLCLEIFRYQYNNNPLYRQFTDALSIGPRSVTSALKIPFLPISFFKTHAIKTGDFREGLMFESSGTTALTTSRHYVRLPEVYETSFLSAFRRFYGEPSDFCIIGLLPSYLERSHSSLVHMVDTLVRLSGHIDSGFYLYNQQPLKEVLEKLETKGQQTILIGVTFALLDFADNHPMPLRHTIVMETGGMKGRKQEITRQEVHDRLKSAFGIKAVHAEYGMTELLSQAYAKTDGIFSCPPWMKVLLREEDDPLHISDQPQQPVTGVINVIDLANIHSCAFIATDDLGRLYPDNRFEVLGRMDASDTRGCSLMVEPH